MRRSLLLTGIAAAILAGPVTARAQFAEGARALGMGGAFTAVADDLYNPFWNPAGAAQLRGQHAAIGVQGRLTGPGKLNDITSHFPSSNAERIKLIERLGGGITRLDVSGDFASSRNGVEFSIAPLATGVITPRNANGGIGFINVPPANLPEVGSVGTFDGAAGLDYVLTYGRFVSPKVAIGLNAKLLTAQTVHAEVDYQAGAQAFAAEAVRQNGNTVVVTPPAQNGKASTSFNMDLGLLQKTSRYGAFGANWRNFIGPNNQGLSPQRLSLGYSDRPFGPSLLLAADIDSLGGAGVGRLNLGAEWQAYGKLALRGGIYRGQPTFGVGYGQYINFAIGVNGTLFGLHLGF